jgi:hypothetical protein
VITRQLQAVEVLSKLPIMNDKSSFVKVPVVITEQLVTTTKLKLYFNNSSRIPTQRTLSSISYRGQRNTTDNRQMSYTRNKPNDQMIQWLRTSL